LVDAGLDVRYAAADGFSEVPAAPAGSHVATVLEAARKGLAAR
jgi:hypothetical protein